MKIKGQRRSSNVQDTRGPTGAYGRTGVRKYGATKAVSQDSKLAKEAGVQNVDKKLKKSKRLPQSSGNVYTRGK